MSPHLPTRAARTPQPRSPQKAADIAGREGPFPWPRGLGLPHSVPPESRERGAQRPPWLSIRVTGSQPAPKRSTDRPARTFRKPQALTRPLASWLASRKRFLKAGSCRCTQCRSRPAASSLLTGLAPVLLSSAGFALKPQPRRSRGCSLQTPLPVLPGPPGVCPPPTARRRAQVSGEQPAGVDGAPWGRLTGAQMHPKLAGAVCGLRPPPLPHAQVGAGALGRE